MREYRRRVNQTWWHFGLGCLLTCAAAAHRAEAQGIFINEFMAANTEALADPQGQYDDWVELYNASSMPLDVGDWYLTDDLSEPTRWRLPGDRPDLTTIAAQGFLIIWMDKDVADAGLHASFSLSSAGEEIGLYEADGQTRVDSVEFAAQTADLSLGRLPDGADSWRLLIAPTPEAPNGEAYEGITAPVTFSVTRGFYQDPITVVLETETEGASIYYTLDGRHPLKDAFESESTGRRRGVTRPGVPYGTPLVIDKTTCLRAAAVKADWQDAPVVTHTYLFLEDVIRQSPGGQRPGPLWPNASVGGQQINYGMDPEVVNDPRYADLIVDSLKSIPTVSLVTDLENLFDESKGIYVHAQSDGRNWERPVSLELIHPDDAPGFHINGGVRVRGGFSRSANNPKHAFRFFFRSEYGMSRLKYPLFGDEGVDEFRSVDLRTSQNYSWSFQGSSRNTMVREVFSRDLQGQMGQPTTRSRYYHLYLNGHYWGLFQTQERAEASFAASYLGGDADDYDVIKTESRIMAATDGNRDAFRMLYDLTLRGFSNPAVYLQAQGLHPDGSANPATPRLLDVDNLIDFMTIDYFTGDRDGPGSRYGNVPNNTFSAYNRVNPDGFKWFQHDSEHSLGTGVPNLVEPFTSAGSQFQYFNPHWLHERLVTSNEEYRMRFADRVHQHFFNGVLTLAANQERVRARADQIELAIIAESARWGDSSRARPFTQEDWRREVTSIVDSYLPARAKEVLDQFRRVSWYPDVDAPVFYVNGIAAHGGRVSENAELELFASGARQTVYYSLDGADPRLDELPQQTSQTLVPMTAEKRVLVPQGPIAADWRGGTDFDDSAWPVGSGKVGFDLGWNSNLELGLDLREEMWNQNASCYVRIPFVISGDPAFYETLLLKVLYDDGFVAYLNGVAVQRANAPQDVSWESHASYAHEPDTEPETFDVSAHRHLLRVGNNILALQGLNGTASSPDFLIAAALEGKQASGSTLLEYTGPVTLSKSVRVRARTWAARQWSALNEAVFVVGSFDGLRVSEIMYHHAPGPGDLESDIEYVELVNAGASTINLNHVRFTQGIDFTFGDVTLEPDQVTLVVPQIALQDQVLSNAYGSDLPVAGVYGGRLSNRGERLVLQDPLGQVLADIRYGDGSHPGDFPNGVDPWPTAADGQGMSLSLLSLVLDASLPENWQAMTPSPGQPNMP